MSALDKWYAEERERPAAARGKLMLGGVVYGQLFLGIFANYCLATILSKVNRAALNECGTTIALYTDEESREDLLTILHDKLGDDIFAVVRTIPDEIMKDHGLFWPRIATAQSLLLQMAANADMAFHVLMPDQVYSENFFPRLLDLASQHRNIVHNGLNARLSCASDLQRYRQADGSLTVPTKTLNDIAWNHLHWRMLVMNDVDLSENMVNSHYQLWRARDRVLMFGPHNSLSFIEPETCKKSLDGSGTPSGTLDTQVQHLVGTDFYVPSIDDDMTLIGFEWTGPPAEPHKPDASREEFIEWCWANVQNRDEHLVYYAQPMANIVTSVDEAYPPVEEIMARQQAIVDMLRAAR